jgi:prepilin-type N-terminal cleavage/methylation domain-containing protein
MSARRRRSGFTLAEVAVSAAILAMLAAVSVPYMSSFLDKQRVQTTADKLAALSDGIAAFAGSVKSSALATSTVYPGMISQLANQILVNNSSASHNSCGNIAAGTFNATAVTTGWTSNGPFVNFYIPPGGLKTPLGMVSDSMVRTPSTAIPGTLAIRMLAVDTADASLLDLVVDGAVDGAHGTLLFTINGVTHLADISYLVPIGGKC